MSEQDTTETATVEETETQETETEQQETSTEDEQLGDAGVKALEAWKTRAKEAERKVREAEAAAARAQQEAALKDKPAEEQELERARAEARAEAQSAADKRILRSELKAAATGKLADPTDAALYINLDDFTVTDNGDVDSDALNEAIDELLTRKPHLAAQKQNRFDGTADQGAKGKAGTVPQWTEADLERATDDETVAAKAAGKLNNLLGIKP